MDAPVLVRSGHITSLAPISVRDFGSRLIKEIPPTINTIPPTIPQVMDSFSRSAPPMVATTGVT